MYGIIWYIPCFGELVGHIHICACAMQPLAPCGEIWLIPYTLIHIFWAQSCLRCVLENNNQMCVITQHYCLEDKTSRPILPCKAIASVCLHQLVCSVRSPHVKFTDDAIMNATQTCLAYMPLVQYGCCWLNNGLIGLSQAAWANILVGADAGLHCHTGNANRCCALVKSVCSDAVIGLETIQCVMCWCWIYITGLMQQCQCRSLWRLPATRTCYTSDSRAWCVLDIVHCVNANASIVSYSGLVIYPKASMLTCLDDLHCSQCMVRPEVPMCHMHNESRLPQPAEQASSSAWRTVYVLQGIS